MNRSCWVMRKTSNTTHIAAVMLDSEMPSKGMCNVHGCTRVHVLHTVETARGGEGGYVGSAPAALQGGMKGVQRFFRHLLSYSMHFLLFHLCFSPLPALQSSILLILHSSKLLQSSVPPLLHSSNPPLLYGSTLPISPILHPISSPS